MRHQLLQWILKQEGTSFKRIDRRWRPVDLINIPQVRVLLKDLQNRYDALAAAEGELRTLDHADRYTQALRQMRVHLRSAAFSWKADQLTFLRAVSGFYESYGMVLRLLKDDEARGLLGGTALGE